MQLHSSFVFTILVALRITTIPANFILDAKGNVVAKNLHGAALKSFVENY